MYARPWTIDLSCAGDQTTLADKFLGSCLHVYQGRHRVVTSRIPRSVRSMRRHIADDRYGHVSPESASSCMDLASTSDLSLAPQTPICQTYHTLPSPGRSQFTDLISRYPPQETNSTLPNPLFSRIALRIDAYTPLIAHSFSRVDSPLFQILSTRTNPPDHTALSLFTPSYYCLL